MILQYTDPKISPENPNPEDMNRYWYVWFRYYNPKTGGFEQLRFKKEINRLKNYSERLAAAKGLCVVLTNKLKDGWNPFAPALVAEVIKIHTVESAINFMLTIKSKTLRKKSYDTYKYICRLFIKWLTDKELNETKVKSFSPQLAQAYMDDLLLTKSYSGRTFNDHLLILRTMFNTFKARRWITDNPFQVVEWKTETIGRNHAYTSDEKEKLSKYLRENKPRLYYATQFLFHCYIRRTELTFIQVKHVDLVNHTIIVPDGKNNSQESVVIPIGLRQIIEEMQLWKYSGENYIFGKGLKTGPNRFKNPNQLSFQHNNIVKKLGISAEKGFYSWKHSGVCAYYYATGKDIYSLMRQLRHRSLETTQIYLKSLGLVNNDAFMNARVA